MSKAEISILLLDDAGIAELNQRYRAKSGPTDVLSFPMRDPSLPDVQPQLLGDIVISLETARRQADSRGAGLQQEIETLLAHGLLHLLGYDHERSAADSRRMKSKERQVLKKITPAG